MKKPKLFTRNFTFLVLGQISTLFGNNMLRLAMSLYILELTGSAVVFAGLVSASMLPTILLSPLGGVLADRLNRRNIMVALDALSGLCVGVAAVLLGVLPEIPVLGGLLITLSVLAAFETPTVSAAVPAMQSGDNIVRANAVINQVQAVTGLAAPIIGGVLYAAIGFGPLMPLCAAFFLLTAGLECFIRLPHEKKAAPGGMLATIRADIAESLRYIAKEQPVILKLLGFAALLNFLVAGVGQIGMPYVIREVLGLSPQHLGAAESAMGLSAILGGVCVGLLATRLKPRGFYLPLVAIGAALLPVGAAFLFTEAPLIRYGVFVGAMFVMQFFGIMINVLFVSLMQRRTPEDLMGKVMSFGGTVCMCAMPLGNMAFGALLEGFSGGLAAVFLVAGLAVIGIGLLSKPTFTKLDAAPQA